MKFIKIIPHVTQMTPSKRIKTLKQKMVRPTTEAREWEGRGFGRDTHKMKNYWGAREDETL